MMMMKCPKCKKDFKSANALKQHESVKHGASVSAGRRPRRQGIPRIRGIDIAPSRLSSVQGDTLVISGQDRVAAPLFKMGSTGYYSTAISVGVSPRLQTIARAYQRIEYMSCRMVGVPQVSVTTSGGFVAGFIMDPMDVHVTAATLSSAQGSMTRKWYESFDIRMPKKTDLLYTSAGTDLRLSSPASFWVITEGSPTNDVTLILTFQWTVRLSQPTVENVADDSFTLKGTLFSNQGNWALEYQKPCTQEKIDDFSSEIPLHIREVSGRHYFRVPSFIVNYDSEGASGVVADTMHFIVYDTSDKKAYYSSDGKTVNTTKWSAKAEEQDLLPPGTFFKYVGQGNVCVAGPPPRQNSPLRDSLSSTDLLTAIERLLQQFSQCSRRGFPASLEELELSP